MENKKSKWLKIVSITLAVIIVFGVGTWGVLALIKRKKYSPNWELAAKLNTRATNAQYLPDASKLVGNNGNNANTYASSNKYFKGDSMSTSEYNSLIEEIGSIWHPYQGDFNIQDVRDIVIYLSENVGVFDAWFRYRGTNRSGEEEDFENIPEGLADGEFYMTFDEKTEHIKIIQSMSFQPWVYDSDTKQSYWNGGATPEETNRILGPSNVNPSYRNNWPVMCEDVMVLNYYYTGEGEERTEVVEAEIVEFLHVYNETIIVGYQSLKNIKDTSFTRYEINCTDSISSYNHAAIDYKNAMEYGRYSNFLQIDYTDNKNISILELSSSTQDSTLEFNGMENSSKINYRAYFKVDAQRQVTETIRNYGEEYINKIKPAFVSLLDSLTSSRDLSSKLDLSNTSINNYEQNIIINLDLAIKHTVDNSYLKQNYENGLKIWDRDAEDITDKIHKPENSDEEESEENNNNKTEN